MSKNLLLFIIFLSSCIGCAGKSTKNRFDPKAAFIEFRNNFLETYAYIDKPEFDAKILLRQYQDKLIHTNTQQDFRDTAQVFLRYFSDPHLNLGPYNELDFSVTPTGSDIWAVYKKKKFFISDVKRNTASFKVGILPGDEVVEIDGLSPKDGIKNIFEKDVAQLSKKQIEFGLNILLGGLRYKKRLLKIRRKGMVYKWELASSYSNKKPDKNISFKKIKDIGYIRFNNSLGDESTVLDFKNALSSLHKSKGLIIDLRDIPSGGNTGVAEPILGHFTEKPRPYQKYKIQTYQESYINAEFQTAYTRPSFPLYQNPYVVLVGPWTGSMGEGMAIGFDAIGAKAIIGSPMADLLGGIKKIELKESQSWMEIGFERLYHVNGTSREDFVPNILVTPSDVDLNGRDPSLKKAIDLLK